MDRKIFCSFTRRELFWTFIALGICFCIYKIGILTLLNIAFVMSYLMGGILYTVLIDEPKWFQKNNPRQVLFIIISILFWLPIVIFKFIRTYLTHKA